MDYKVVVGYDLIANERNKDSGLETYMLDRYLSLQDAIHSNDVDRANILMDSLFGVSAGDFDRVLPQRFPKLQYHPLVFLCVEKKFDDLAYLILSDGALSSISYKVGICVNIIPPIFTIM